MVKMYLSVIVPAYNEAKRIGSTIQAIGSWLSRQPYDSEIIIVDNNSNDSTVEVVRGHMHHFPFLRLIKEKRPGKGYAVTAGMLFGTGQVRLFTDADNSTSIEHFTKMEDSLKQGYDVVIGSLAVKGAKVVSGGGEPWWRVILGKLGNLWIQVWAVPGIWDTQRGFKVFSAKAVQAIFPKLTIFGWGFDVEVLALARINNFKIKELPVTWDNDPDSKVNIWAYPRVLWDTMKVGINRIFGRYNNSQNGR